MEYRTLRELCETLGVTRRAVQGYEKAGLVKPSSKNERGHLLYDQKTQERISRILLYQHFGFTIKEIKQLIDAPDIEAKKALINQARQLEVKKVQLEKTILKLYELIDAI